MCPTCRFSCRSGTSILHKRLNIDTLQNINVPGLLICMQTWHISASTIRFNCLVLMCGHVISYASKKQQRCSRYSFSAINTLASASQQNAQLIQETLY